MADDYIPEDVETNIDKSLGSPTKKPKKRQPSYQIVGESKIPVAKAAGKLWKSRLKQAEKINSDITDA